MIIIKTIQLETLSMLVEGLKDEHPSLARESLQLTMALLATAADPDLKTSMLVSIFILVVSS